MAEIRVWHRITDFRLKDKFAQHLAYVLVLPAAFFGSALLYNPFGIQEFYTFGNFSFDFNLIILSSIILLVELVMRTILYFMLKRTELSLRQYEFWCVGEMLVISAFAALYTCLAKGGATGYLDYLEIVGKYIISILCVPYIIMIMVRIIRTKSEELEMRDAADDNSLVRFYDEHKRLKLSIAPSSILYVKSEFNYVKIYYLDAGRVKEFVLRASMKSLESTNNRCLVRCQRSYFVNPEHVTVLRKDKDGFIYAELNTPDVPSVPVSKQYYDSLTALL